jgi:hypothetical protein
MTEPFQPAIQPAVPPDHATHDAMWMAALASRDPDLDPTTLARAQAVLVSCGSCADLFADLVAVSAAIPAAAVPKRPRDFTLTAADAARLRPGGIRSWLAAIGSGRDRLTFPLAMGLTTLGIAGLLLATLPGTMMLGAGGAASAPQILSTVGAAIPAPAATAAPAASAAPAAAGNPYELSAAPSAEAPGEGVFYGDDGDAAASGSPRQDANGMTADASVRDGASGFSTLVVVAGALLLVGIGLFLLRWTARRL